ncbi:MAG: DUF4292 domain-containing protein [Ignavibacteriae bacterium]|nr:DUF4292 domain-containing protein [Ignavibacteriota bacterium]
MKPVNFYTQIIVICGIFCITIFNSVNAAINCDRDTTITADSLRGAIMEIIDEVNRKSASIDLIHSENVIKIKTATMDETGSIEVRAKKKDDLWFRIYGSFAFVSKDAFIAHFNRKKFLYFDNLNDKVIEGPTNDTNIGYIARIRCSFDDLLNVMTGTVNIPVSAADTLELTSDKDNKIISVKNGKGRMLYYIDSDSMYVKKYSQFLTTGKESLRILFSVMTRSGTGYYSRRIEILKPLKNEYLKIYNETYETGIRNLDFKVDFPGDVRRVRW